MKPLKLTIFLIAFLALQNCKKQELAPQSTFANGDFEGWSDVDLLQDWKTNSCPACYPAYETYVVQKTIEAYHGKFAAKFIYNGVFPAIASNTIPVSEHPSALSGYLKCQLVEQDTVSIKVRVFSENAVVDSGQWLGTSSVPQYKQFVIPLTHASTLADSVQVLIKGGNKLNGDIGSIFWVDYLSFR